MTATRLRDMDQSLLTSLVLFHTTIIALSNYLVTIPISIMELRLTWAAFTFPLIVVATDLTIRLVNKENARMIVSFAFLPAILASTWVIWTSGMPFVTAVRIGAASGAAYLASNLLDIYVFQKVRERMRAWFWAPAISAIFANVIDTFTFFFVAFYQSASAYMSANWYVVALGQTGVKVVVSLLVIMPLYGFLLAYLQNKLQRRLTARND